MIFILALLVILVWYGMREYRQHQDRIMRIPHRIHVNGTRGKSSVTRLITGGLQEGGIRTLGKTTGTTPCYLDPSGQQVRIERIGKANIVEQVKVVKRALSLGVDTLVVECMAVIPGNQKLVEDQMIHATIGVITNARADHLDEMGPTVGDVARALSATTPTGGILFTSEETWLHIFEEVARNKKSEIRYVGEESVTDAMMKGFTYLEHKSNVALALAVCEEMGVSKSVALRGMQKAIPDPGVLRIFTLSQAGRTIEFVNAFAANDPDSYVVIWNLLTPFFTPGKKVVVVVNCRKDRVQRTEALAELIARKIHADHFLLVGELTTVLEHRARALGLPGSRVTNLVDVTAEEVYEQILAKSHDRAVVIGIGNIVGFGEEIVTHITNRGSEYAY